MNDDPRLNPFLVYYWNQFKFEFYQENIIISHRNTGRTYKLFYTGDYNLPFGYLLVSKQ